MVKSIHFLILFLRRHLRAGYIKEGEGQIQPTSFELGLAILVYQEWNYTWPYYPRGVIIDFLPAHTTSNGYCV